MISPSLLNAMARRRIDGISTTCNKILIILDDDLSCASWCCRIPIAIRPGEIINYPIHRNADFSEHTLYMISHAW